MQGRCLKARQVSILLGLDDTSNHILDVEVLINIGQESALDESYRCFQVSGLELLPIGKNLDQQHIDYRIDSKYDLLF